MSHNKITVIGARENNLKNITVEIPRDKLVVITGLSGSGKSSLAFDTIYAEGQRRYVESLSSYARQFLGQMEKPDVDSIDGLSPAVSIDQKSTSHNPRSTVGTVTEIYDYFRLLYARVGTPYCPNDHIPIESQSSDQIIDQVWQLPENTKLIVLAPLVQGRKGEYKNVLKDAIKAGFVRVRIDGEMFELSEEINLDKNKKHTIEIVIDRLILKENIKRRLADAIELALKQSKGIVTLSIQKPEDSELKDVNYSELLACPICGFSMPALEPRLFSFNSPFGACPECTGLGTKTEFDPDLICPNHNIPLDKGAIAPLNYKSGEMKEWWHQTLIILAKQCGFDPWIPYAKLTEEQKNILWHGLDEPLILKAKQRKYDYGFQTHWDGLLKILKQRYEASDSEWVKRDLEQYMSTKPCPACKGKRLKLEVLSVLIDNKDISQLSNLSIDELNLFFDKLPSKLTSKQLSIGERVIREILERLKFLQNVGLGYLTLDRTARTLAGGEAQRIRLATQIGSGLMGCLYVLDEPSIGLHQRDNHKLIDTLIRLRNLGNTVIVVEHDEDTMRAADWLIELGPAAGENGGYITSQGTLEEFLNSDCSTAQYLKGTKEIPVPTQRRKSSHKWITIQKARGHNLKNIDVQIPLGVFTSITGVSGSGKSTLIQDTLFPRLMYEIYGTRGVWEPHESINGLQHLDKVVDIDQSPIGRTPRSNPATYTGTFDMIRELFSLTPDAKMRGYQQGRFSFNVKGGRCEACKGDGILKIEMHFLPDVYVPCEVCHGKRYNRETLEVKYRGKSIADILAMNIDEAAEFFQSIPKIARKLNTLQDVGLGYIRMGQSATTLSGGEAQRIKLATELSKRSTGSTIYILDEPTTGLHFEDVQKLLGVLHRLVEQGNTVLVIEHNLDVIKTSDWIIDLGPEGGAAGGQIVVEGTPETVAEHATSYTGQFLKKMLKHGEKAKQLSAARS